MRVIASRNRLCMFTGMGIAGIIFDCDGVLVDSEIIAVELDQQALQELGIEWTRDEVIHNFLGKSDAHNLAIIEDILGRSLPDDWLADLDRKYRDAFATRLKPIPGIRESLEALGLPVCVASSGSHEKIRNSLQLTDLANFFGDNIFSSSDVTRGKPEPDLFLHAAAQMGWNPANTVVVEDSNAGITAALRAGMTVIAYAGGLLSHDEKAGDKLYVIQSMTELPELLSGL